MAPVFVPHVPAAGAEVLSPQQAQVPAPPQNLRRRRHKATRVLAGGCCHVPLAQGGRPGEGSEASVESRPGLDPGEGSPLGSPGPSVMGTPEDSGVRTGWGHSHTTDSVPVGGAGVSRSRARAALPAGLPGGLSLRPTPHSLTLATGYPLPTRGSLSVSVPCP